MAHSITRVATLIVHRTTQCRINILRLKVRHVAISYYLDEITHWTISMHRTLLLIKI